MQILSKNTKSSEDPSRDTHKKNKTSDEAWSRQHQKANDNFGKPSNWLKIVTILWGGREIKIWFQEGQKQKFY